MALCTFGCRDRQAYRNAAIHGVVTLDGDPVEEGRITFFPASSGMGSGGSAVIKLGEYHLKNVPLGEVGFTFSAIETTGRFIAGPGGAQEPERINPIPEKYQRAGLAREITESGKIDFQLTRD